MRPTPSHAPSTRPPRARARRALSAVATLALAVGALVAVPGAAHAAVAVPGGTSRPAAVPLPVADLDSSFTATNAHMSTARGQDGQAWYNVTWYSWTPPADVRVYMRATSTNPVGWDNTLEVWSGSTMLAQNDDSYALDAALRLDLRAGTSYRIGLGGYHQGSRGEVTLQFATRTPTAPREPSVTAAPGGATVTWAAPSDLAGGVTGYRVLCTPEGGQEVECGSVTGTPPPTSTTVVGLTNGTRYAVRVVATNVIGDSEGSAPVTVVPQATSATTVTTQPEVPVSGQPFTVRVAVTSSAAVTGTVDVTIGDEVRTGVPLVDGAAVLEGLVRSAGPLRVSAAYAGTTSLAGSAATHDTTVVRRAQQVTLDALPADLVYAGAPVRLHGSSDQGLPVTYSADGACAVRGDVLDLVDVGTCTVTAAHAGDSETEPASATVTAEIGRRSQSVALAPLPALVYGQAPAELFAASSVGLPVQVDAQGACRVEDGLLVVTDVGPCTVTAVQDGDERTSPAQAVVRTGDVARRPQTVTIGAFAAPTLGRPVPTVVATSDLGLPVTLTATGACTVVDGALVAVSTGECVVTAQQAGDARTLPGSASTTVVVSGPDATVTLVLDARLGSTAAGAPVSGRGEGLRPGTEATLVVHSTPRTVATGLVAADGTVELTGVLPTDLEPGTHRLVVSGTGFDGRAVTTETTFVLADDGTFVQIGDRRVAALATTGGDAASTAGVAALWLVLGAGLVVVARRRAAAAR
jgi:hypothetical protein